jgi:MAF protein
MPPIILASTSPYRKDILSRLGLPLDTVATDVDETPRKNEQPAALVSRLAESKAAAVAEQLTCGLVIGSDQVAVLDDTILGKPGSHENASRQLAGMSGKSVIFYTGLCVINAETGRRQSLHDTFKVTFRTLTSSMIENYLHTEKPYNCAGSFKSEGLGIALFAGLEGTDPNTLIGLPLIKLVAMLENEGVRVI